MMWRTPTRAAALSVAAAIALAGSIGGVGTYALWSDTATVEGTTIGAGNLDLTINDADGKPTPLSWTGLAIANMAPGESSAGILTVKNNGSVPFTLLATGAATGTLTPHLTVRVVLGASATNSGTYPRLGQCVGGTQTFSSQLTGTAGTVASVADFGTMTAGSTKTMCVEIMLPTGASNAAQGGSFVPTFAFTATQQ